MLNSLNLVRKVSCTHCKRLIAPKGMTSHVKHCPVLKATNSCFQYQNVFTSGFNTIVYVLFNEPKKFIWWVFLLFVFSTVISKAIEGAFVVSFSQGKEQALSPMVRWLGKELSQGEQDLLQQLKGTERKYANGTALVGNINMAMSAND
jgi:phage FluMu protein Com